MNPDKVESALKALREAVVDFQFAEHYMPSLAGIFLEKVLEKVEECSTEYLAMVTNPVRSRWAMFPGPSPESSRGIFLRSMPPLPVLPKSRKAADMGEQTKENKRMRTDTKPAASNARVK